MVAGRLFLCAVLLLGACAPLRATPRETVLDDGGVSLPLVVRKGSFLVPARLDGRGPFALGFDTGSSVLTVSQAVAREVDLATTARLRRVHGPAKTRLRFLDAGPVGEVALGERGTARFRDVGCWVIDLPPDWQGLFGLHLLSDCLVTLDGPGRRLHLGTGALPEPDGVDVFAYELFEDIPALDVGLGGRAVRVGLDTGYNGWIRVPEEVARTLEFRERVGASSILTVHGTRREPIYRLAGDLRLGGHTIPTPFVQVGPGGPLLGTAVLGRFKITFDVRRRRVRFG